MGLAAARLAFALVLPLGILVWMVLKYKPFQTKHLFVPLYYGDTGPGYYLLLNMLIAWQMFRLFSVFVQATAVPKSIVWTRVDVAELVFHTLLICTLLAVWAPQTDSLSGANLAGAMIFVIVLMIFSTWYLKHVVHDVRAYQGKRFITWLYVRIPGAIINVATQIGFTILSFMVMVSADPVPIWRDRFHDPYCPRSAAFPDEAPTTACEPEVLNTWESFRAAIAYNVSCASEDAFRETLATFDLSGASGFLAREQTSCESATDFCVFTTWRHACRAMVMEPAVFSWGYRTIIVNSHVMLTYAFMSFGLFHSGRIRKIRGKTEADNRYDIEALLRRPHLVLALLGATVNTFIVIFVFVSLLVDLPFLVTRQDLPLERNSNEWYYPGMCQFNSICSVMTGHGASLNRSGTGSVFVWTWVAIFLLVNVDMLDFFRLLVTADSILDHAEEKQLKELASKLARQQADQTKQQADAARSLSEQTPGGTAKQEGASKHTASVKALVVGASHNAALGLHAYMGLNEDTAFKQALIEHSVEQIQKEFEEHGTENDRFWLEVVLNGKATERAVKKGFMGYSIDGVQDAGRVGETLNDFCSKPEARKANLTKAHVLALRLYTTPAFRSLNIPLRTFAKDDEGEVVQPLRMAAPHKFPVTVHFIAEGIRQMRALNADQAVERVVLWRGLKGMQLPDKFLKEGGTEMAPMSTTDALDVALPYSQNTAQRILFKIVTETFMERGASLSWLSAFPSENEYLYPPLTYLKVCGPVQKVKLGEVEYSIVEVKPSISS